MPAQKTPEAFTRFEEAMKAGDITDAMAHFTQLHLDKTLARGGAFVDQYFIAPVLEHKLLGREGAAPGVKVLELHVLINALTTPTDAHSFDAGKSIELGRQGLQQLGAFSFLHNDGKNLTPDILVQAEVAFGKRFQSSELFGFAYRTGLDNSLAALANLYLSRDDGYLPINCPRSLKLDRDAGMFADHLTAASIKGLGAQLDLAKAKPARVAALMTDILESAQPQNQAQMLEAMKSEFGAKHLKKLISKQADEVSFGL